MTGLLQRYFNPDLERDVVGAAIIRPGAFLEAWDAGLRGEHMGHLASAIIWRVCERLFTAGVAIDSTAVLSEMSGEELQEVGRDRLFAYVVEPRYSHVDTPRKAKRLVELARLRRTVQRVMEIAEDKRFRASAKYMADELQALALELMASSDSARLITGDEACRRALARAESFVEDGIAFVQTGWPYVDRILGGLRPGHTYALAAHDKAGKTQMALDILLHNSRQGRRGLLIPLESDYIETAERWQGWVDEEIAMRTAQGRYDQRLVDLMRSVVTQCGEDAQNVVIPEELNSDRRSIEAAIVRAVQQYQIEFFVLDYIQLVEARKWSKDSSTMELYNLSRWLKTIAKKHRVAGVVLTQYSDKAFARDDKTPQIADIFGGGALRKDCAGVLLLDTPWKLDRDASKDEANLIVANNRFGPTAVVAMSRSRIGRYREIGIVEGSLST